MKKEKKVLVTTEFRGVFYGEVIKDSNLPEEITLKNARNCIYWSSDCGGFLGLTEKGPSSKCRIGTKVSELRLFKITSVSPVSKIASGKWESD